MDDFEIDDGDEWSFNVRLTAAVSGISKGRLDYVAFLIDNVVEQTLHIILYLQLLAKIVKCLSYIILSKIQKLYALNLCCNYRCRFITLLYRVFCPEKCNN